MTQAAAQVVRRQIVVNAPIEDAFATFTARFGDFKPPEHNLLVAPIAETVFEPRAGGHIYDRATDGTECHWAVLVVHADRRDAVHAHVLHAFAAALRDLLGQAQPSRLAELRPLLRNQFCVCDAGSAG